MCRVLILVMEPQAVGTARQTVEQQEDRHL